MDGPAQRGDLGEPLSSQVVPQGPAQCVKRLIVVQDALALPHVGSHAPRLGPRRPGALSAARHLFCFAQAAGGAILSQHPEVLPGFQARVPQVLGSALDPLQAPEAWSWHTPVHGLPPRLAAPAPARGADDPLSEN